MIMRFSDIISIYLYIYNIYLHCILFHFRAPFRTLREFFSADYMLLQKSRVSISTIHDPYMNDYFEYLSH